MSDFPPLRVAGELSAVGVITTTILGILPPMVALIAFIWYVIQITESKTIQRKIRACRLRRLVRLRAKAVALELAIRNHNFDLRGLDEANQVHLAAAEKSAVLTHETLIEEQKEIERKRLEETLFSLQPPGSTGPAG